MSSENLPTSTGSFSVRESEVPKLPFPIPGATPDKVFAQLLNVDVQRGMVTTIIHLAPGASIPAHYHQNGAEAHFVLEGDFIDAGTTHTAGALVTQAMGVVHGPHGSQAGCRVLTLQTSFVDPSNPDFHIVDRP